MSVKIKKYKLLISSIGIASIAQADIIYTNIEPDTIINMNGNYNIDIDGNGLNEFTFNLQNEILTNGYINWLRFTDINPNVEFIATATYIKALNYSSYIGPSANFSLPPNEFGYFASYTYGVYTYGSFNNVTDKYIGLKLTLSGNNHYGWIRVDGDTNYRSFTIKDYAFNSTPDQLIKAGTPPLLADTVSNILINDITDNINCSDIQINFQKAIDESTIEEYRIVIIPESNLNAFNPLNIYKIDTFQYETIIPNNLNHSIILDEKLEDYFGNTVNQAINYIAAIISIPKGTANTLSVKYSDVFKLEFDSLAVSPVNNLNIQSSGTSGNSTDFIINFTYPQNQLNFIKKFKIYALNEDDANSFNVESANSSENYLSIYPFDSIISQILPITMKSFDGNTLEADKNYCFYVVSESKGTPPYTEDTLSLKSNCNSFKLINEEIIEYNVSVNQGDIIVNSDFTIDKLELYNINGSLINSSNHSKITTGVTKGVCFLKISSGDRFFTDKIILY